MTGTNMPALWDMLLTSMGVAFAVFLSLLWRGRESRLHRYAEHKLRALLNAAPDSAMLLGIDGTLIAINAIGAARFHKTPEELEGKNFFSMIPEKVARARQDAVAQVITSRQSLIFLDQRDRYFLENRIYPLITDSGDAEGVAVFSRDITEKHQAETINTLFQQLDRMLLEKRVSYETLARRVCDELLILFNLSVVWIGTKDSNFKVRRIAGADATGVFLDCLDHVGVRWDESPEGAGPSGMAIRTGQIQMASASDPQIHPWQQGCLSSDIKDGISFPITVGGSVWGALTMYSREATPFLRAESRNLLETIADRLSLLFETARQQEQLHLLETALASASNAAFITDIQGIILWCNQALVDLTGYTAAELVGVTPRIFKSNQNAPNLYVEMWQTILGGSVWKGEVVDQHRDGKLYTVRQTVTPLQNDEGRTTHFITIQEDVTEQRNTRLHMERLANYDALTDLPNRNLFFDRLQQAIALAKRQNDRCALMFLDLDHFKNVNDQLGHQAGDELLKEVASRLRQQVRESDTVARLAGDEFTIILGRPGQREDIAQVAEKIVAVIGEPYALSGDRTVHDVGVSIGLAIYPQDGEDGDSLVRQADKAMYMAKSAGRSTYRFSDETAAGESEKN